MIHYTIHANKDAKPFFNPPLALLCCNDLLKCHTEKKVHIRAFCLMPDHLHLCINGTKQELKVFIDRWKSFVTHASWKNGWSGKLWQERFYATEANGESAKSAVVDYVLRNPQKAGLVKS